MNDNWQALNNDRPELRDRLKEIFHKEDSVVIRAKEFIINSLFIPMNEIIDFLDKAASIGLLEKSIEYYCPFENCGHPLSEIEINNRICTECGQAYIDSLSKKPIHEIIYVRHAMTGRDVRWFLALHGMNTRGAWQEEFNWRVSNTFNRSIPVAIYKYGIIRVSVLLPILQKKLVKKLKKRIDILSGNTHDSGFGEKPDVVAHSFGTWILGHLLESYPETKVGRIILTGSILRPDFNWTKFVKNNQVEMILNHISKSDLPVKFAQYFIPNSGPSGFRGFDDRSVYNIETPHFKHSDYFDIEKMIELFKKVWWPFLQKNKSDVSFLFSANTPSNCWNQSFWAFRGRLFSLITLIILSLLSLMFIVVFFKGILGLFRI